MAEPEANSMAAYSSSGEIRSLTGLRGIAACWVMLGHYEAGADHQFVQPLLDHKYIAVDLFMVLSGFVLARVYGPAMGVGRWRGDALGFVSHRIARIYPLYLLTVLICLWLVGAGWLHFGSVSDPAHALPLNLLMVQSWGFGGGSLDGPAWSISAEWAANLLFPLLALGAFSKSRTLLLLTTSGCALGLMVAAFWVGAPVQGDTVVPGCLNLTPDGQSGMWALLRCTCEFYLGMTLWRICLTTQVLRYARGQVPASVVTAAIVALAWVPAADVALLGLFCGLLLCLVTESSLVARALSHGVVHWLGLISFSIYLLHVPLLALIDPVDALRNALHLPHALHLGKPQLALMTLGMATLSYYWVERPAQRYLRRWFEGRKERRLLQG